MNEHNYKNQRSPFELLIDYDNYIKKKRFATNKKSLFKFKDEYVAVTRKQIEILNLIAKGFSNSKIAKELNKSDNSVKLSVYRLIEYFERTLNIKLDRYLIIIVAQNLVPHERQKTNDYYSKS